jgi:superoxide reductase
MKNMIKFYKCENCGNVIHFVSDAGNAVTCCHQQMTLLKENIVDAAVEKHVPVAERSGNVLSVSIGATLHPMTPEHHIDWIAVVQGDKVQIVTLENTGQPQATLSVDPGDLKVYEYCNLHGLWAAEFKVNDGADQHIHSDLL